MRLNEFTLALVGVVIGLGVADLLTSFHKLLRAGARVKWDWLTLTYAGMMLYALIVFWWWQFGYPPAGTSLTIAGFLPNFAFLAISFLMVAAALPDNVPTEGLDLRAFYLASLRHRWGLLVTGMVLSLAINFYFAATSQMRNFALLSLPVGSAILAALAIRIRATWFQALTIAWIVAVTSYFNLFHAIGP
jgi:hypothetical protein